MASALFCDASDELWKECAKWLTRWGMLRDDHRANWPEASIADLANILRDGVLLCKLLNKIDPGCIDMKDVNLKPSMAQFLSLRNIELFLKTCTLCFGLKESDLFEPLVLFELSNFHKVLCTLSKLSLSSKALKSNIIGFAAQRDKTKEDEVIYQSLKSVDLPSGETHIIEPVYDVTNEEIYQDLCLDHIPPELQPSLEKRDFVIKELIDTERNYVEVLSKLRKNFMRHLYTHMKPTDFETVFHRINELFDVHSSFYQELKKSRDGLLRLSIVFMKWRERFLVYGDYCANLTKATNLLQSLCDDDENFNQVIIKYEKDDNNGRFKLRDVLSVPMQRILKYHLLLEKLIENTDPNHEEYNDLKRAREAMLDVAGYINESARDSEHMEVINNLQENIVEWTHPTELKLCNYGRLIKDGELKIKGHDDQKVKNRYVFIFDKCILICKQLKSEQFAFRDIINIAEYYVDEIHNRATLNREGRWSYSFLLVKNDNKMVYTIYVRTVEAKNQMMKAMKDALDNISPVDLKKTNHKFEMFTCDKPVQCSHCSKYLRGLIHQGYKCAVCKATAHKSCIAQSGRCGTYQHQLSASHSSCAMLNGSDSTLRDKLWFVGEMDRNKAQDFLEGREDGTFLVRIRPQSEDRDRYALTLKTNNTVKHMKIICNTERCEKKYYLSQSKFFSSIEELVLNYQIYSLKENFERLDANTRLLWPYRQLRATATKDFDTGDPEHLRLLEGGTVIIIGKEGHRDGWWKGRIDDKVGYFPSGCVRVDGELRYNSF